MSNEASTIFGALLACHPGAKRDTIRAMVRDGRVSLNGKAVRSLKQPVGPKDAVTVAPLAARVHKLPEGLKIVHEDAALFVIRKPAGLLTSSHENETRVTALALLQAHARKANPRANAYLVHRLDKDASGLLVFARSPRDQAHLKRQFFEHSVHREYVAVVHGRVQPPAGRLKNMLIEGDDQRVRAQPTGPARNPTFQGGAGPRAAPPPGRPGDSPDSAAKPAALDYRVEKAGAQATLVKCVLFTGRKHQVRVQWQIAGHPVLGDAMYGTAAARDGKEAPFRLALHACALEFEHPRTGRRLTFAAPAPPNFVKLIT